MCKVAVPSCGWGDLPPCHTLQLPELLDSLHDKLGRVTNPQTKTGTLRCVRTVALLFTVPAVTHLLNKPLNYEP